MILECLNCGRRWNVLNVLSHVAPGKLKETVEKRVKGLIDCEDTVVKAIVHGGFTISPKELYNWKQVFFGEFCISTCPRCHKPTFPAGVKT